MGKLKPKVIPVNAINRSRAKAGENLVSVTLRNVRISPQKMRLVLNEIKGCPVIIAERKLATSKKKGARILEKLLRQAEHEARIRGHVVDEMSVVAGWVDSGIKLKRFMPAAQGRAVSILKRFSHVTVVLGV